MESCQMHILQPKHSKIKEKEIKEKIGSEAKEKLQRGEKVNWAEFQLMLGDDDEEEDSTF